MKSLRGLSVRKSRTPSEERVETTSSSEPLVDKSEQQRRGELRTLIRGAGQDGGSAGAGPSGGDSHSAIAQQARDFLAQCSPAEVDWVLDAVAARERGLELLRKVVVRKEKIQELNEIRRREGVHSGEPSEAIVDIPASPTDPEDPNLPIVQFSSQKYFCVEYEHSVILEVLRLQTNGKPSTIRWETRDHTAIEGKNYVKGGGLLHFEADQLETSLEIRIIDDSHWGGMLEFHVAFLPETAVNCRVGESLRTARVQRIDDEVFPTDTYRDEITSGRESEVPPLSLLQEYFILNMHDAVIRNGAMRLLALGQMKNIIYILSLCMNIFLVDTVLVASDKYSLGIDQQVILILMVVTNVAICAFEHFFDFSKYNWGIAGKARRTLMCGLVEAFLNYSDISRSHIANNGDLTTAMVADTETVVKAGFMNIMLVFQLLGKVVMCMLFQALAPKLFGASGSSLTSVQMIAFPVVMASIFMWRMQTTKESLRARAVATKSINANVGDLVNNFRLIADYGRRWDFVKKHEALVLDLNKRDKEVSQVLENNTYLVRWLTVCFLGTFTIISGIDVVQGGMSTGVYLTCIRVLSQFGSIWSQIYSAAEQAVNTAPALERITRYINMESDCLDRMHWNKQQRRETRKYSEKLREEAKKGDILCSPYDMVPIQMKGLALELGTELGSHGLGKTFCFDISVNQGSLVCVVGKPGFGKSTLLRVLGGAKLPTQGANRDEGSSSESPVSGAEARTSTSGHKLFIPSHLRVLHVSADPMFIRRGVVANLTFGITGDHQAEDGNLRRIKAILNKIGLSDSAMRIVEQDVREAFTDLVWVDALSSADRQLLHLARAFLANPDVLCMHKPTMYLGTAGARKIFTTLREFVSERGVEMSTEKSRRRPKTVIFTTTKLDGIHMSEKVLRATSEGIQEVAKNAQGQFDVTEQDMS